jgi:[acyl-carrier-protein] S-malonyltransferase
MTTAWVFPGQGSQVVGMGVDLQETAIGKTKYDIASSILGWSIVDKCQGDETELSRTLYTQPCLYVIEAILSDLLRDRGQTPDLVAGHSLGEYSALYTAGVFDFESGLRLVHSRSQLMDQAKGGKMAALIKFDREQLEQLISQTPGVILANDNSPEQVVISGIPEAVDAVLTQVKAKRALPLKVSGAFHSPFMAEASTQFETLLTQIDFQDAKIPVLSNVNPSPTIQANDLKSRLIAQMTRSVRWREIMLELSQAGTTNLIEVGPGKVLTGLVRRTCPGIDLGNVSQWADISVEE